jgi:hypothetical protein
MLHDAKLKLLEFFTARADDERLSKVENLVEGLIVYVLIVTDIYMIIFVGDSILASIIRAILLVYMMAIGPLIHGNTPEELGIGNVKLFKQQFFDRKKPIVLIVALILIVLSIFVFQLFIEKFENVLLLVPVFGALNQIVAVNADWLTMPLVIFEYVLFQVILILILIRKDNLWISLKSMWKPFLFLICVILVMSLVDLKLFKPQGDILDFLATWYGYTFWGLMQQLPFLVYLSARFRKGFPFKRASQILNIILIALFFGFFHAPQWPLVVVTFIMELFLARSFILDDTRNLFTAGLVHGFAGTMLIFFTNIGIMIPFA